MTDVSTLTTELGPVGVCAVLVILSLLVVFLVNRAFHMLIAIGVALLLIPVLITVFWGDGSAYLEETTKIFPTEQREKIMDGYCYFRAKDQENPVVNEEAVLETYDRLREDVLKVLLEKAEEFRKNMSEDGERG